MTIYVSIERDLAAGAHKSYRCKAAVKGGPQLFMSTRNAAVAEVEFD